MPLASPVRTAARHVSALLRLGPLTLGSVDAGGLGNTRIPFGEFGLLDRSKGYESPRQSVDAVRESVDDCLDLEPDPRLVVAARAFVESRLRAWEAADLLSDAVLVTSELVTNAVLHARTQIRLRVAAERSKVRVEVYDDNTRIPILASCATDATSGRGLVMVAALVNSWGIEQHGDGKVVWAELGPPAQAPFR